MADTGAFQDISNELKIAYPSGTFEDPVNKETRYRKELQKVELMLTEGIGRFPLGVAAAWNVGIIPDVGTMPAPIDPTRIQGEVTPEVFVGSFQIGGKTKAVARSTKSTFSNGGIMADRVERTVEDLGKVINAIYVGSTGGVLASVSANSGSNTIVLNWPQGVQTIKKNMRLDFYTGATPRTAVNRKITTRTASTATIIYDGANDAGIAPGDNVYLAGTYGRTVWSLDQIVGDATDCGTIYVTGVRASYPELSACVYRSPDGKLRDVTEQLILEAIDGPRQETGKKINKAISNSGQARKFVEMIQAERRYMGPQGQSPKYAVGYDDDTITILAPGVNVKLEVDYDCAPRRMYFLSWESFGRYEAQGVDWIDEDALLKMIPVVGGHKFGFLAYVGAIENQINTMPRANARLDDLADPLCGD